MLNHPRSRLTLRSRISFNAARNRLADTRIPLYKFFFRISQEIVCIDGNSLGNWNNWQPSKSHLLHRKIDRISSSKIKCNRFCLAYVKNVYSSLQNVIFLHFLILFHMFLLCHQEKCSINNFNYLSRLLIYISKLHIFTSF